MGKIINFEEFQEGKNTDEFSEYGFKEIDNKEVDELFNKLVHNDNKISKDLDNLKPIIFNDKFIMKNAKKFMNLVFPRCTICYKPLNDGDNVDPRWPNEFGYNICKECEEKLPEELKNTPIQNLDHLKQIYAEEDYKKIMKFIKKKDRFNIMGHNITTQKLFENIIKYIIDKNY